MSSMAGRPRAGLRTARTTAPWEMTHAALSLWRKGASAFRALNNAQRAKRGMEAAVEEALREPP
jgi:hypothetical protein